MKRKAFFIHFIVILFSLPSFSQAPQNFRYQSVARNEDGDPLANTSISVRISIRNLAETGSTLYQETHSVTTNSVGLFSLSVGGGSVVSGNFANIDWSLGAKFIALEVDFKGGSNYTSMGSSQLLSVPYALYSANGKSGVNGLNILNGTSDPTSGVGVNGEFYINTTTNKIFGPKAAGIWPVGISLIGTAGPSGINGTNGTNGLNILNGTSDPTSGVGVNGEFYINTTTNKIFGPKAAGIWPVGISLIGTAGPSGINGTNGTNGLNILNGTSDPTPGVGVNGEFYINTTTNKIFGPKATGNWPAGISLVGPAGSANAWGLSGNSGTLDGTSFIGTTDNVPLNLRVNNQKAGRVSSSSEVFLGYQAGNLNTGGYNVGLGYQSLMSNSIGYENTATGYQSLKTNVDGTSNSAFGSLSLFNNTSGYSNTAIGQASLYQNNTGFLNSAVGVASLWKNTSGALNSAQGYFSLGSNTIGWYNSAFGANALGYNTTGTNNTSVGQFSLGFNTTGNNNTAIGFQAGFTLYPSYANTTGSNNTFIGYNSGPGTSTQLTNATAIGYQSLVSSSNSLILGGIGADAVKVGIGVSSPGATLDILGNVKIKDGTEGAGKVLTSDANGLAIWSAPAPGNGWGLAGNTGTVDGTNFIGTTDNVPITFKLNNQKAGRIESENVFFGYLAGTNNAGNQNVGIGKMVLMSNSSGDLNTAVGHGALNANTSGKNNSAFGAYALMWNTSGQENTATGLSSLANNSTGVGNTAVGYLALGSNTTTNYLTAVGSKALYSNTSGTFNTAIGYQSLYSNTTGLQNTATGYEALFSNTTGSWNVADGYGALYSNTTGQYNTAIGFNALYTCSACASNTAIGYSALQNTSSGIGNTATGEEALFFNTAGSYNTANGVEALRVNTTGQSNSAFGEHALALNTTGSVNTALGSQALYNNTDGVVNVAVGYKSLYSNTSGSGNVAIGNIALNFNTTGGGNTATGWNSLYNNTTGDNNTAAGRSSLNSNTSGSSNVGIGFNAAFSSTTGSNNTAIGYESLYGNTIGDNNTALGYRALTSIAANYTNSTAIGYNAQVTASNMIRLGDANVTSINGAVDFTVVSDERFKKDISENVAGLSFIMKLRPVTYHLDMNEMAKFLKTPAGLRIKESEEKKEKVLQTGFIAQEVEKAASELDFDFSGVDKPESDADFYGLRYAEFTVPLVKAVQEQQNMIQALRKEVLDLKDLLTKSQAKQEELKLENTSLKVSIEARLRKLEEMLVTTAKK